MCLMHRLWVRCGPTRGISEAVTGAVLVLFAVATLIVAMASRPPTVMRSGSIAAVCAAFAVAFVGLSRADS